MFGCEAEDNREQQTDDPQKSTYFVTVSDTSDLNETADLLLDSYASVEVLDVLESSNSLLMKSDPEDYELMQSERDGLDFTDYYAYGETDALDDIVRWSRFFVSETDAGEWLNDIDTLYYMIPGDSVEVHFLDLNLTGTVKEAETSDAGNRYIVVDSNNAYFSVFFGTNNSTAGTIYPVDSDPYTYKFDGSYGYVMPEHELTYLTGALGLE